MNHRPKCKTKTVRLLVDNIGENLDDHGFGYDFLDTASMAQSMEELLSSISLK